MHSSAAALLVAAVGLAACGPALAPPQSAPVAVAPPAPTTFTPAQIAARGLPAVVSIKSATGLGTGFVVRKDGWIATNLHVIAGARALLVTTQDRRELPVVEVLAVDGARDLALVRVEADDMRVLTLGDSDAVRPGDSVVAIGHPLGLEDTVSNGLVSAIRVVSPVLTVLQISAPIAPGSSGGPLFSDRGEVIGVTTALSTKGQNLGFGVPVRYLNALLGATHPVPIADFGAASAEEEPRLPAVKRAVPTHDLSLLAGCSDDDMKLTARTIGEAIDVGAPVYNEKHFAACYHVYEGAAEDLERRLPAACAGPKRALHDGRTKAGKLTDPSAQAWAMRDAFDGLIDVILRKVRASKK